jgi:hypothetical protein
MSGFPLPPIVVDVLVEVIGVALGAFLRTTLGMIVLGVVAAIGAYFYAASSGTWHGVLAIVATLGICAIAGGMLALKRSVLVAVRALANRHRVGAGLVEALFDRIAAVPGVSTVERIPLGQAEQALSTVVRDHVAGDGYFRRRISERLIATIEALTLARFRDAAARDGGVDLALVRGELSSRAAELVDEQLGTASRRLTILFVVIALALSALLSFLIARA